MPQVDPRLRGDDEPQERGGDLPLLGENYKKEKDTVKASSLFLEREKGLLPISLRFAADCQPYGLDARL